MTMTTTTPSTPMSITTTSASSPIPVAKNEEQRHPDNQNENHKSDQRPHALRPLPASSELSSRWMLCLTEGHRYNHKLQNEAA